MRNINLSLLGGAVITGNYRYLLWREWNSSDKTVTFIMLNPSRANAFFNDPTITRCINFAKSWGAQCVSIASRLTTICAYALRRLEVVNLFAYRTPHPSLLKQAVERTSHGAELNSAPVSSPIGKDNDRYIIESVEKSDRPQNQERYIYQTSVDKERATTPAAQSLQSNPSNR